MQSPIESRCSNDLGTYEKENLRLRKELEETKSLLKKHSYEIDWENIDLLTNIMNPKTDYEQENHTRCLKTNFSRILCRIKSIKKWCTDFTYLFLKNHDVRYNCSIIDLHDRSVIARHNGSAHHQ